MLKPATGLLAGLAILPVLALDAPPAAAQTHHVLGHGHYWYAERAAWAGHHHFPKFYGGFYGAPPTGAGAAYGPYAYARLVGSYPYYRPLYRAYYQPRWGYNPYWRAELVRARTTPNYFSSGVGYGTFACDWDPAYRMDPRCLNL